MAVRLRPPWTMFSRMVRGNQHLTIYVALLDEGTDCWRPVAAEHISADLFRIADEPPEDEQWEFQPGQIVALSGARVSRRQWTCGR
jgi:hypothetical protein